MLTKSLISLNRLFSSHKNLIPGVKTFTNADALHNHLKQQQATFTAVYFRSSWNPECLEADKHVAKLHRQFPSVEVVAVDSDHSLELKRQYDIKYQPQIVLCLFGDEVTRHVGVDYDNLRNRLQRVMKLPESVDFQGLDHWVPFGTVNNAYYDFYLRECLRWARQ